MHFVRLLLVAAIVTTLPLHAAKQKPTRPTASAPAYKGAIVVDAASGRVLFEDNAHIVTPPASVTKLMTLAVVEDRIKAGDLTLDTPVTVTADDSRIGGTQVWLKEGEVFTVEELLYALMVQSANDAASALARTAAGSRAAFVELMNAKAQSLGMKQTTFRTPHGLPPPSRKLSEGDLTSPHDLALLSRELIQNTDALRYTSTKQRAFRPGSQAEVVMRNHNHLLGKIAGVDGLKTGFTNGAGFCLSATAERNGRRVIAVVMGSPDAKSRDIKVAELLERGFAALPVAPNAATSPVQRVRPATPITTPSRPAPAAPAAETSPVQPATSNPSTAPAPANEGPTVKFELPGAKKP